MIFVWCLISFIWLQDVWMRVFRMTYTRRSAFRKWMKSYNPPERADRLFISKEVLSTGYLCCTCIYYGSSLEIHGCKSLEGRCVVHRLPPEQYNHHQGHFVYTSVCKRLSLPEQYVKKYIIWPRRFWNNFALHFPSLRLLLLTWLSRVGKTGRFGIIYYNWCYY